MQQRGLVFADAPEALVELCGISVLERLLRTLQRCGIDHAIILSRTAETISDALAKPSPARAGLRTEVIGDVNAIACRAVAARRRVDLAELFLVVRGDTIYDSRLIEFLLAQGQPVALSNGAAALAPRELVEASPDFSGLTRIDIDTLPQYSPALRRNLPPFCFSPAQIAQDRQRVERALINATQKGAQDFPAMLHAPIEKFLVARLCKTPVTPHQLTIAWIVLAIVATALFATGHFGWGIALAFVIGILDGLDGKLARLRVETSNIGKLEHRFDSFFEVAWPSVIALYLVRSAQLPNAFAYLALLIAGQIVDGLAKGAIYRAFAKLMRPPNSLDRVVRCVGVRRNVFIWILLVGVICGAPAKGLIFAAWWQLTTAIVDLAHAVSLRRARTH